MGRVLVLHYHEIWLKGGNKNYFLSRLKTAIKRSVADLAADSPRLVADRLLLVPRDEAAVPILIERLRRVFGLAYMAVAREVTPDPIELGHVACEMMAEKAPASFAVRAKIADSSYGMNSMEVERELGRAILTGLRARGFGIRVNLDEPQVTCWVEIVAGMALVYTERIEGAGGLPAATSGRLLALLSGGFDSAVAAYKMMRRGAHLSFVHFYASPSVARGSSRPVAEQMVRALTPYQYTSRLYLIPFESIQRQIVASIDQRFRVLLYRRMMVRIAREIARAERALGLVTGDSVSQVASQTLHNLAAIDRGLTLPVYRPLAGDDKVEIMRLARQIGTYEISCQPFEDCCPRFMPKSPAIFAKTEELDQAEAALDLNSLVTQGLEAAELIGFKYEAGQVLARPSPAPRLQKLIAWRKRSPHSAADATAGHQEL